MEEKNENQKPVKNENNHKKKGENKKSKKLVKKFNFFDFKNYTKRDRLFEKSTLRILTGRKLTETYSSPQAIQGIFQAYGQIKAGRITRTGAIISTGILGTGLYIYGLNIRSRKKELEDLSTKHSQDIKELQKKRDEFIGDYQQVGSAHNILEKTFKIADKKVKKLCKKDKKCIKNYKQKIKTAKEQKMKEQENMIYSFKKSM